MSESNGPQLDSACRILTLSSSLTAAKIFIKRLKALSIQGQSPTSNSSASSDAKTSEEESIIPWTIVNRYYTADVHFAVHVIHGISPMMFDKPRTPPAVIYVWVDGESYVKQVEELSRIMGGYEPEVCLAVRIPKSDETAGLVEDHSETEKESNTDIDTVLMSYGFEYIDATGQVPLRHAGEVGEELSSTVDIPHLPRVLDALSTIMWPSMKSGHKGSAGGEFDNKSRRQRDLILEELLHPYGHGTMPLSAIHRESEDEDDLADDMQEVLRSEERKSKGISDTTKIDVPKISTEGDYAGNTLSWLTINSGKTGDGVFSPIDSMSLSPFDTGSSTPFGIKDQPTGKFSIGFEDDFTAFVSAPAVNIEEAPDAIGYRKPQDSPMPSALRSGTLEPGSASVRYQSLGSDFGGSDFGDEEPMYESLDDDGDSEDDDLPTKEEIRETSGKIFGKVVAGTPLVEGDADDTDGDERVVPFDLSQVMDALQQFKSDISGMDDEEERRKAAAKVALGLVYGLEIR